MIELEVGRGKKDIEFKVNSEIYGFNMTNANANIMDEIKKTIQATPVNRSEETLQDVCFEVEDKLDEILGEGSIEKIFGDEDPTILQLGKILEAMGKAILEWTKEYDKLKANASIQAIEEDEKQELDIEDLNVSELNIKPNRAERRKAARKNRR